MGRWLSYLLYAKCQRDPVASDRKLVPGFRSTADGPAPFVAPDLEKLPWKMKQGVKEFELVAQPVQREFLPGYYMNVWGYNGSVPGPTIEVNQGDRIRIIAHNELPEDTTLHCHGFELPVQFDGSSSTDDRGIVRYAWDFGDGSTGSGPLVQHVFRAAGTYEVRLTVTSNWGVAGNAHTATRKFAFRERSRETPKMNQTGRVSRLTGSRIPSRDSSLCCSI